MCLSMLPTWAWAAGNGTNPDDMTLTASEIAGAESDADSFETDGEDMDEPVEQDKAAEAEQEENSEPSDIGTENDTQDEDGGMLESEPPVIETVPGEEPSDGDQGIAPVSIRPETPNAEVAIPYLSQFPGVYRINRNIPAKDWSIEIAANGDVTLLYNSENTGAVVTAIAWNGSAVTSLTFSNAGQWFASNGTTNQTLAFCWNTNGYFTMPNITIYNSARQSIQAFTNGAVMYNETGLKQYFTDYAGKYSLNDGSGWYAEIDSDGGVTLSDGKGS